MNAITQMVTQQLAGPAISKVLSEWVSVNQRPIALSNWQYR